MTTATTASSYREDPIGFAKLLGYNPPSRAHQVYLAQARVTNDPRRRHPGRLGICEPPTFGAWEVSIAIALWRALCCDAPGVVLGRDQEQVELWFALLRAVLHHGRPSLRRTLRLGRNHVSLPGETLPHLVALWPGHSVLAPVRTSTGIVIDAGAVGVADWRELEGHVRQQPNPLLVMVEPRGS